MTGTSQNVSTNNQNTSNKAEYYGDAAYLLSTSRDHLNIPVGSLNDALFPALTNGACEFIRKEGQIVAIALWALVDKPGHFEGRKLSDMKRADWKCGDKKVLIDVIAPSGDRKAMLAKLREKARN